MLFSHFLHVNEKAYVMLLQVRMANINPADVVDKKAKIILGLMWTIILNFQVMN